MNMLVGHDEPLKNFVSTDVAYMVVSEGMMVQVMDVQAPTSATIGYLLGLDPVTTDCKELTNAIRANTIFAHIFIYIIVQLDELSKDKAWPDWNSNKRINAVTIKCAAI